MHNNITHINHQQYQQYNVILSHLPSAFNTCRARWNLCQPLHFHNFRLQYCYHRNHRAPPLLPSDGRRPTQNTHHAAEHTPRHRAQRLFWGKTLSPGSHLFPLLIGSHQTNARLVIEEPRPAEPSGISAAPFTRC